MDDTFAHSKTWINKGDFMDEMRATVAKYRVYSRNS